MNSLDFKNLIAKYYEDDSIITDIDYVNTKKATGRDNDPVFEKYCSTPNNNIRTQKLDKTKTEIDIREIVYGNKPQDKIEFKQPKQTSTSGVSFIQIEHKDEHVYRDNGSLECVNQYLLAYYRGCGEQVFKNIAKSPYAYERLLCQIIQPILLTNDKMLRIESNPVTQSLLGNPTSDDVMTCLNGLIKQNKEYSAFSIKHKEIKDFKTKKKLFDSYSIVEPVIYNKKQTQDHYYEDIDGMILPNQEGYNKSPDMLDIFFKNLFK